MIEVNSVPQETPTLSQNKELKMGNALKNMQGKVFLVVATELVPTLESKWGVQLAVRKTFPGSVLENCRYIFLGNIVMSISSLCKFATFHSCVSSANKLQKSADSLTILLGIFIQLTRGCALL